MGSFEFNDILKKSFENSSDRLRVYNINPFGFEELRLREKIDEKVKVTDKTFSDIKINDEYDLNTLAKDLWDKTYNCFKSDYTIPVVYCLNGLIHI